jgi:hypothetical protein
MGRHLCAKSHHSGVITKTVIIDPSIARHKNNCQSPGGRDTKPALGHGVCVCRLAVPLDTWLRAGEVDDPNLPPTLTPIPSPNIYTHAMLR